MFFVDIEIGFNKGGFTNTGESSNEYKGELGKYFPDPLTALFDKFISDDPAVLQVEFPKSDVTHRPVNPSHGSARCGQLNLARDCTKDSCSKFLRALIFS